MQIQINRAQNQEEKVKKVLSIALACLNAKYKYGATLDEAPHYFDCSSFVKFVFAHVNVNLPRCSIEQIECGIPISLNELQPADLIFVKGNKFHTNDKWPNGVGHVAIYLGNNKVIHAYGKAGCVCITPLDELLTHELRGVRRLLV